MNRNFQPKLSKQDLGAQVVLWIKIVNKTCEHKVWTKCVPKKFWTKGVNKQLWTKAVNELSSKICELRFEQNYEQKCEHVFE